MKQIVVKSERLSLAPHTLEEMLSLQAKEQDEEMKQAYGEMIEEMRHIKGHEEWAADWKIQLEDGTCIGGIGFKGLPDERGCVEVGYGIDETYRRKGYATEAVKAMTTWALAQAKVDCVQAQTEDQNEISKRVLRKNGFQEVGRGPEGPLFERRS